MKERKEVTWREFVRRSIKAGVAVSAADGLGLLFHNREQGRPPKSPRLFNGDFRRSGQEGEARMAICVGDAPGEITRAAVSALGGMRRFVAEGESVCIKPNAAWDRILEQAANTHPEIVRVVVAMCLEAGARKVTVTDVSCNDPLRSFARSGIGRAAQEQGAAVLIPRMQDFGEVMLHGKIAV